MLDLSRISLLCLDTRRPDLAEYAIRRCLDRARFGEVKLLTHGDYRSADPRIQVVPVGPIRNRHDYSAFMMKELLPHVGRDHVLVIQWDGFMLDAGAWNPALLDYDYVGAPWPHRPHPVGNGGFSLRSRRLLEALQDPRIIRLEPEDECICADYRSLLEESHGIRFAPLELARQFAFELSPPDAPTFGFHGFFNFHQALDEGELLDYLDKADRGSLLSVPGRRLVKNLISAGMYAPARHILGVRLGGSLAKRIDALKLLLRLNLRRLLES